MKTQMDKLYFAVNRFFCLFLDLLFFTVFTIGHSPNFKNLS